MKSLFLALFLASVPSTPDVTKEDVVADRKNQFLKLAEKMQTQLPEGFVCQTSFHDQNEMVFWECLFGPTGRRLGSLWVWQKGEWAKIPGIFSN